MAPLRTSSPHVFIGGLDDLTAAGHLEGQGAALVIAIGTDATNPEALDVRRLDLADAGAPAQVSLEAGAAALKQALKDAALEEPGFDTHPGDSSDSDCGSTDGCRLRVRVSKATEEEKWGVTWHSDMFKRSQRLVVDEVRDGTVFSHWNDAQDNTHKLRYGDRLIRINSVRAEQPGLSAKACAVAMRAELHKLSIRAVFWRPGESQKVPKEARKPPTPILCQHPVLVLASPVVQAAAIVLAHEMLSSNQAPSEETFEQWAQEILSEAGTSVIDCNGALRDLLSPLLPLPLSPRATTGKADGSTVVSETKKSEARELEVDAPVDLSEEPALELAKPQWVYSCRKCGLALFHDLQISPHKNGEVPASSLDVDEAQRCTSLFVEAMQWMGGLSSQRGKLECANPRCKQKLGAYCWHGLPCSCGEWQSPAFQVHRARVDCMPVGGVHARGPIPVTRF